MVEWLEDAALGFRERLRASPSTTPTFFEIVRQTLDRGYADIEGERDERIKARLVELDKGFESVLIRGGPDYADPVTRFAYVYKYTPAHADYLDRMIQQSTAVQQVLNRDKVSITCIGGGPGSDVLGFLKFLLERGDSPHITYFILDKEPAWGDTWSDLDDIVTGSLRPSRVFRNFDITKPTTYANFRRVFESDIFTMVYFLSEVFFNKPAVTRFLKTCFAQMKPGALLIVIDIRNPNVQSWIDQCAMEAGLQKSQRSSGETKFFMDSSEEKSELKFYTDKFGIGPKITSRVFYRVFRKPLR
jgi:hypothetical protein